MQRYKNQHCVNHISVVLKYTASPQQRLSLRFLYLNAGLQANSQRALGRSYGRPARARFSVVFLGHTVSAQVLPKIPSLHASHAALTKINFTFSAKTQPSQRDQNLAIMLPSKSQT